MIDYDDNMQPYDKCLKYGTACLSDAELLAIIVQSGTKGKNAVELAGEILSASNGRGFNGLYDMSVEELKRFDGIGRIKAIQIKAICEMSARIAKGSSGFSTDFSSPVKVVNYYMEDMRHLRQEKVMLLMLDNKSHLIKDICLTIGTVNISLVSARDVFRECLKADAVSLILLHNHPSGDPSPSDSDYKTTGIIKRAGELMDIPLIDHIIIGDRRFFSFKRENLI